MKRFKHTQRNTEDDARSDVDRYSEGGDIVGSMPQFSVIGGNKRRNGSSEASRYSMSSSSMFRNAGLTMIDEQFDQVRRFTVPILPVTNSTLVIDRKGACIRR